MKDLVYRRDVIKAIEEIDLEIASEEKFDYEKWRDYFKGLPNECPVGVTAREAADYIEEINYLKQYINDLLKDRFIKCEKRMPDPGSWAIWKNDKGHVIVARWKEDAIDHFWPDQRDFYFPLEEAVEWAPLPKEFKEDENG